jgi:hypothetical protein
MWEVGVQDAHNHALKSNKNWLCVLIQLHATLLYFSSMNCYITQPAQLGFSFIIEVNKNSSLDD